MSLVWLVLASRQGIQDLLICLEMLVAAVFFFYAFPLSDYLRHPDAANEYSSVPRLHSDGDSAEEESHAASHVSPPLVPHVAGKGIVVGPGLRLIWVTVVRSRRGRGGRKYVVDVVVCSVR